MNETNDRKAGIITSNMTPQGMRIPDLPKMPPVTEFDREMARDDALLSFAEDYREASPVSGFSAIVDSLLKRPGRLVHAMMEGPDAKVTWAMLLLLLICMAGYGFVVGTFSGGGQLWSVPLKVVFGTLASGLICLPSLYIFLALSGGKQNLGEVARLFLAAMGLGSLLLIGFAPVTWIFSQSTGTAVFMGILHLLFWFISMRLSMQFLKVSFTFLNQRKIGILGVWMFVFLMVILQMTTVLRPLVGPYNGMKLEGKKFFVTHWFDCMSDGK